MLGRVYDPLRYPNHQEVAMNTRACPTSDHKLGWTLVTLAVAATLPLCAFGADRVVLGEHFAKLG